jgi:hypothetical protein
MIAALLAASPSALKARQVSSSFALRAAVLRLAIRGLWSVACAAAVPVAGITALEQFNRQSSGQGGILRSWPAASRSTHHVRKSLA